MSVMTDRQAPYSLQDVKDRIEDARFEHPETPVVRQALTLWLDADPVDAAGEAQALMLSFEDGPKTVHAIKTDLATPDRVRVIIDLLQAMDPLARTGALDLLQELMIERCQAVFQEAREAARISS